MRRLTIAVLLMVLISAAQTAPAQPDPQNASPAPNTSPHSTLAVPAGTAVELALTSPILSRTAKAGESVYAQTAFPVAVNNQIAIPPGTYVEGQIDSMTRPGWLSPHAQFQIHFTKIIFANGYTVVLPGPQNVTTAPETAATPADDVLAAVASPYVEISSSSDVLLDNGSQLEMILQVPLQLLADRVAAAAHMATPEQLPQFRSATLCRPSYGTPGSPDTVIPGTPGTPPTVIPGGPGMPDTVIPGTPGTPSTTIPGSPGTPGTVCPGPPVVTSNPKAPDHKETFQISALAQVGAMQLPVGTYQVVWSGSGPSVQVEILQQGKIGFSAPARVVVLDREAPSNLSGTHATSDGSVFLESLRFAGQSFALYFDQGGM